MEDVKIFRTIMFPPMFKWVGFAVAAAGFALLFILRDQHFWVPAIAGLWIAMWSRERRDDEMMRQVRLAASFLAFAWTALWVIICNFLPLRISAESTVFGMLLLYHFHLWVVKWRMRREKYD